MQPGIDVTLLEDGGQQADAVALAAWIDALRARYDGATPWASAA